MNLKDASIQLTRAVVDLRVIRHNLQAIVKMVRRDPHHQKERARVSEGGLSAGDILAVIKADAYGHGMLEVARLLKRQAGVQIAVSDIYEGCLLREAGIKGPILLLETSLPEQARRIVENRLTPTVCGLALARAMDRAARNLSQPYPIHVKVDTGMRRQGVRLEDASALIRQIAALKHLKIQGLYTHFPSADTDPDLTRRQIRDFQALVDHLDQNRIVIPFIHAANSAGLVGYQTGAFNLFRPGLMLYGLYPSALARKRVTLKPALSVVSRILLVKEVRRAEGVSYGHSFKAKRPLTVAIVPIGYNDGYFRAFSNKASVLIAGQRCPVLGRVTMDQIVVDVSGVNHPKPGMDVVVLGRQRQGEITADELAGCAGTISYEITCALGGRLPKVFVSAPSRP